MRQYVFYSWTTDESNDYLKQYGLSITVTITKHKTDCMLFGTKVGDFDSLKEAKKFVTIYIKRTDVNCYGIYDNEERDWIKDW